MRLLGNPCRVGLVALLALMRLAGPARADTLDVPAEYPTIQAAIVAAAAGDTVLVAPGTYLETIDFLGKAIMVQSNGGAAVTTIDGGGAGSVVTFQSGETQSSLLDGFTVTGGTGSEYKGFQVGGGIKIVKSGPKLTECHVVGNTARDMGGGVYLRRDSISAPFPLLVQCTIEANSTIGPTPPSFYSPGGGGFAAHESGATLTECRIAGNTTHHYGGGLAIIYNGSLSLTKCVLENNAAAIGAGGLNVQSAHTQTSYVGMNECIVRDNTGSGVVAALYSDTLFLASALQMSRTIVTGNTGAGVSVFTDNTGAIAELDNCLIAGNVVGLQANKRVFVDNCTIVDNQIGLSGLIEDPGNVRQCILWNNAVAQVSSMTSGFKYCDVQGGFPGPGNIDIDPHFVDPANGDYHLAPTSACIDAGDPAWLGGGTDIDGDPRVLFGRIDIGADEATIPKGPWTYLGHALAGGNGAPTLFGAGPLAPGSETTLSLDGAVPGSACWLVAGAGSLLQPFKGGVMVPTLDLLIGPLFVGPTGSSVLSGRWPNDVPPGFVVRLQDWIADPAASAGFAASNGLSAEAQ